MTDVWTIAAGVFFGQLFMAVLAAFLRLATEGLKASNDR